MTTSAEPATGFPALGLSTALIDTLSALGYEEPTPIQREAIPPLLEGRDLLGQAATGTGKTAAFALPLIQRFVPAARADGDDGASRGRRPSVLILAPTRELAMQVAEAVHRYGKALGVCAVPIYGGQAIQQQLRALRRGVDVVVATPGRALDLIRRGSLDLSDVRAVVLDEADEMLDMGFADDLEAILERHLREPVHVKVASDPVAAGDVPRVRQSAYFVQRQHKIAALGRVLDMENPTAALVFCRTRTEVDELTESLNGRGYRAEALHGGMEQEQRDRVMRRFREGTADLLIATDVAARGLDIEHISHVVNFDVPSAPEAYVHRIGRTGRAGREGVAITFAEPREHRLLRNIEHVTGQKIQFESVPTVVDLRARRLELTRGSLREALLDGDFEQYRVVVEDLAGEFDLMDVAAAAVGLAHEASAGVDDEEEDIPAAAAYPADWGTRQRSGRGRTRDRGADRGDRGDRAGRARRERGGRRDADATRLYIGLGRLAGIRPGDLVGAIANEAGIDARAIGSIDIADRFSIVEVPEDAADNVIEALRQTTIRGKRVSVRRDRFGD
jgi:ATP-dependent RNA helicase DeaD